MQIYNNTLDNNFQGDHLLSQLRRRWRGPTSFDLANNTAYDNTITVGTRSGALASVFSYASLHLGPGRAVSERLEEPDILPQHLLCAIASLDGTGSGTASSIGVMWQSLGQDRQQRRISIASLNGQCSAGASAATLRTRRSSCV